MICLGQMRLSAAEKQHCDADPERRATYLQTHREKRHEAKRQGKVKAVKDFSEREKSILEKRNDGEKTRVITCHP